MLRLLEVSNLALIDNLSFYPAAGLNVITGETGAGKSLLIGAIELLTGERASSEAVRGRADAAQVSAVFCDCDHLAVETDTEPGQELVLSREIRRNGPNICRVNGRVQPLSALASLGQCLLDLHGQNRQQSLHSNLVQRQLLDDFGDENIKECLAQTAELYAEKVRLQQVLAHAGGNEAELARRADFLRFQLEEIEVASLSEEEEEELARSFRRLTHARQLAERTARAYAELYEGTAEAILDRLGHVEKELAAALALDETLDAVAGQVSAAAEQLAEAARQLRDYRETISTDEGRLQEVAERLELYRKLKKKYGPTVADVLKFAEEAHAELGGFARREKKAAEAAQELADTQKRLAQAAAELGRQRRLTARELGERITAELQDLALQGARFSIIVTDSGQISAQGCDRVEFMFSANTGEPELPLCKVASGGEVARIALAVKCVLARQDNVPTLVFDEIDSGIGGMTVKRVADKLKELSAHRQVICVTHQPQIAAAADHHFVIYKRIEDGRTLTHLDVLEEKDREKELARMLGGSEGDEAVLGHARQLLR